MTPTKISTTIVRCIEIQRLKATLDAEEKELKARLIAFAEFDDTCQQPTDGGGWSWEYTASDQSMARVTQPGPKLKSKLDPEAAAFAKIKEAAGRDFMRLFIQVPAYRPVEDFRDRAESLLGKTANKLIKLVTTDSTTRVEFEVKGDA